MSYVLTYSMFYVSIFRLCFVFILVCFMYSFQSVLCVVFRRIEPALHAQRLASLATYCLPFAAEGSLEGSRLMGRCHIYTTKITATTQFAAHSFLGASVYSNSNQLRIPTRLGVSFRLTLDSLSNRIQTHFQIRVCLRLRFLIALQSQFGFRFISYWNKTCIQDTDT